MRGRGGGGRDAMMKMIMGVCGVAVSLVIMMTMISCVDAVDKRPDLYVVGVFANGWEEPLLSLVKWTKEHDFYVGDWLFFGYNQSTSNVLVVNQTDFNKGCRSVHPLENITGGNGQDLFQLTSEQTYYFVSGKGYCQKLAVIVKDVSEYVDIPESPVEPTPLCPAATETPEPEPSPPQSVSPSDSGRNGVSTFIGTIAVACTLVWGLDL